MKTLIPVVALVLAACSGPDSQSERREPEKTAAVKQAVTETWTMIRTLHVYPSDTNLHMLLDYAGYFSGPITVNSQEPANDFYGYYPGAFVAPLADLLDSTATAQVHDAMTEVCEYAQAYQELPDYEDRYYAQVYQSDLTGHPLYCRCVSYDSMVEGEAPCASIIGAPATADLLANLRAFRTAVLTAEGFSQ